MWRLTWATQHKQRVFYYSDSYPLINLKYKNFINLAKDIGKKEISNNKKFLWGFHFAKFFCHSIKLKAPSARLDKSHKTSVGLNNFLELFKITPHSLLLRFDLK